ncbi:MAG TPA: HlyD family efflux transporter periplasmic adaptor subunit [Steroidobacteraceae bacterium]|nr:HlyD family efflux transporter periplasmic adaptor subunit [Steroidobacteraceae bacterium]
MNRWRPIPASCVLFVLAACGQEAPRALGTLEWDRITLPSPAAERIVGIEVREGQRVHGGDLLLQLEPTLNESQLAAAAAQARQSSAALAELKAGPRVEELARARATLAAAEAEAVDARAQFNRVEPLGRQGVVAAADVDAARAAADNADAQARAAREALRELENGSRAEDVAQGEAAAQAAQAQAGAQRVLLGKLTLAAPRDGQIDSIPYKLGDQAPVGAPLVVMLAGAAPFARVYVPERLRAGVHVGDAATVHVDGSATAWPGTVRMIRSDPTFTPYYALTGQDADRLSYLAEIQLTAAANALPAGVPLWAEFRR